MGLNFTRGLTALAIAALPLASLTGTFSVVGADAVYAGNGNGWGNGKGNGGGNRGERSSERGDRGSDNRGNANGQGGGHSDEARGHGNGNGQGAERSANDHGNGNGNGQGHDGGRSAEDHGQGNRNGQGQGRSAEEQGQGNGRGAVANELKGLNACHASDQGRANANPDSQVGRIATYATAAEQNETAQAEWQTAYDAFKAFEAGYEGRSSEEIQDEIRALTALGEIDEAALGELEAELVAAEAYESERDELGADADAKKVAYETADAQSQTALSEWKVAEAAYETAETEDETKLDALAANVEAKRLTYEAVDAQSDTALDEWITAEDAYEDFEITSSYIGRSSDEIKADIDDLTAPGAIDAAKLAELEDELADAQNYEIQRDELVVDAEAKAEVYDAAAAGERTALSIASGGRELSDEAVAALRSCLEG